MRKFATTMLATLFLAMGKGEVLAVGVESDGTYTHTDRLIVRMKPGTVAQKGLSDADHAAARERVGRKLQTLTPETIRPLRTMSDGAHILKLNRRLPLHEVNRIMAVFANDPDVLDVVPDRLFFPQTNPNDSLYPTQWNLTQAYGINMPAAWDISSGLASMVIGILDTGYLNHADLEGRWIDGYDFVSNIDRSNDSTLRDTNAGDPGDWVTLMEAAVGQPLAGCPITPSRWHGTAMAGIIGANANNAAGVAGINWNAKLLPVRVVGKCGGYESDIADGMRWAVGLPVPGVPANANPAKLLNISLAAVGTCGPLTQGAIDEVLNARVPVIVSSGNQQSSASNYSPGNCAGVITVGATDRDGRLPVYANTGVAVGISAPGGIGSGMDAILTTLDSGTTVPANDNIYASVNGTSAAAAAVTGIASLMLSVNPTLLPRQVAFVMQKNARGFPADVMAGRINCNSSLCGAGIAQAAPSMRFAQAFGNGSPMPSLAAGIHNVGLRSDGRVFQWTGGAPVQRTDISGVRRISAGADHVAALHVDGSVWIWSNSAVEQVPGLSGVMAVASGSYHWLALKSDGTVWSAGDNSSGQLGDGTTINRASPVQVTGLSNVVLIGAGYGHSLAVKTDGTVWAWGSNDYGQIGDGTTIRRLTPVQVAGLSNVKQVTAGNRHSHALKNDGTLWSWGSNNIGQLGDGTGVDRSAPVQVSALSGMTSVATGPGGFHTIALKSDGTAWTWGENTFYGQLGDGTTISRLSPVQVSGLTTITAIAASTTTSLAVKSDGTVMTWGNGNLVPVTVSGPGGVGTLNLDLSASSFAAQVNVAQGEQRTSNTVVINGIAAGSAISVEGGQYRIDSGTFAATAGTINPGQSVTLRMTASPNCATTTSAVLTIAGVARSFSLSTVACDAIPDSPGVFATQANVTPGSLRTSNNISITGINTTVPVSITGGEYSIGCTASFTSLAGSIGPDQNVCVRQSASNNPDTVTTATLTVGPYTREFHLISAAGGGFTAAPSVTGAQYSSMGLRSDGLVFTWGGTGPATQRNDISGVKVLVSGFQHVLALRADGKVWASGNNDFGQMGVGVGISPPTAIPVPGLSDVIAVAAGTYHSVALKSDGTVWAWGYNGYGQIGDGTLIDRFAPTQVAGISNVVSIATGFGHVLAVKSDGTVWAWGDNSSGQIGDGTLVNRSTPVQTLNLTNVVKVVSGTRFSLALKSDGTVWAWGANETGQLGDGTGVYRSTPVQITALTNIVRIVCGPVHGMAQKSDGTVWAWGSNLTGELGDGTLISRLAPVAVGGLTNVLTIGAGNEVSLAIKTDGSVMTWGHNTTMPVVVQAPGGVGTLYLLANDFQPDAFSFSPLFGVPLSATLTSNSIAIAGLGMGVSAPVTVTGGEFSINGGAFTSAPAFVSNGDTLRLRVISAGNYETVAGATVTIGGAVGYAATFYVYTLRDPASPPATPAVALGESHSLLLNARGNVFGFGYNGNGQLGNGSTFSTSVPTAVSGVAAVQQISSGANHSLVVTKDGTVQAWGFNDSGQLGISSQTPSANNPVDVAGLGFITAVAAGRHHSLALKADGTVWAWGLNTDGQLGDGSMVLSRSTPAQIPSLSGVVAIAAGNRHSLALLGNGNVMVWGANDAGQLGDGSNTKRTTPVLAAIANVASIAAGGAHSLIVKRDGTAWAWGANGFGQLGNGNTANSASPVALTALGAGVGLIAAGENHSLAVKSRGGLFSWGSNLNGQLGDGLSLSRSIPFAVANRTDTVAIAAGGRHSAAIDITGTLFVWGDNYFGQVGNKTGNFSPSASGLNVLQGASQISTYAQPAGSSTGTASSSGSAVIEIAEIATGYDFKTLTLDTTGFALGKFKNQALTEDITGIAISVSGPGFSLESTTCLATLGAGTPPSNECGFTLKFAPTVAGDAVGELQVASSLLGSPERRSLFGTGLPPATPGLKITATAGESYLAFAPQNIGTASVASEVVIANTGSAPLVVSGAVVTSGASHFSISGVCTTTIAVSGTCNLPVIFNPDQASSLNGQLTLTTNAGTRLVALSGTVVGTSVGPTVPGSPNIQSVVPGNGQLTIHFLPPAFNGGATITGYAVTCNPGNATVTGATSPLIVSDLTNGIAYSCSLTANNAVGTSTASGAAISTPSASPALTLVGAVSRKLHNGLGPYGIDIDLSRSISQDVTIEQRNGGAGHVLVFTFNQAIAQPGTAAAVDAMITSVGTISSVATDGNSVIVTLAGIPDKQRVTIGLSNVNNIAATHSVSIGFLLGDVTNTHTVSAADIAATKARSGQTVNANTARYDVNLSGTISNQDVSMVKARAGNRLP